MEIIKGENKFYIGDEHSPTAKLTYYHQDEDTIVVDHTYVSESLRGQGIAGKLFETFVDFVREQNLKVVPQCSYIETRMDQSTQYNDIRA